MSTLTGIAKLLSGAGYTAPECHYTLKEGAVYKDTLPDATYKRIDELFHASIVHKNQFNAVCFTYTIEKWKNFFLSRGAKSMFLYGSSSRQSLDKNKEFSQEYINEPLEIREDRSADMDFLITMPGADKKERAKLIDDVLRLAISEMHPEGNAPENEIHRLRRTLFVNLSNKDGKGRYEHLKFLIFSLNSSIQMNGRDIPLKIDFVISGNHYPLLFNIDQFKISVVEFLDKKRFSPHLQNGLEDILQLSRRRLIPNPEINYDELSFIKRLNRSLQGFYLPFSEDKKFVEVTLDPHLHRKSKKLSFAESQVIQLEKAQRHISDKEIAKRLKKRLNFEDIQAKAFEKYFNCSISLTVFAFQLRLMFKKDLIKLQKLSPIHNPSNWQEKLINWMQVQLYNPAFFDKIPTLSFLLLIKMIEGESGIRIYEDALRICLKIQKATVFLFLPLEKLEFSSHYLKEIKEALHIEDEKEALERFLLNQMTLEDEDQFRMKLELIKKEFPLLLETSRGALWLLKAFQKGWVSKETALSYAHDTDVYFNALEKDEAGFGRAYLQKFPNIERTLVYYSDRSFHLDEIRKSIPKDTDIDTILVKLNRDYDLLLKRLRDQKDLYLKFDLSFVDEMVEELVLKRGHYDLEEIITYYLSKFKNKKSEYLAVVVQPQAHLDTLERLLTFVNDFPYPIPISMIRQAILLVLNEGKANSIDLLHTLYENLKGKRGETITYMNLFQDHSRPPHKIYKPLNAPDRFYITFYYEACLNLLDKLRPVEDYDFILNQLLLILPDLNEEETRKAINKWLTVRHVKKEHMIDHFTTSLARISNFMDQTIPKTKKLSRLKDKILLIGGLCDPNRKISLEIFREAMDLFSLDDPSMLEQVLFIVTNSPLAIRQNLDHEFCRLLFDKSVAAFKNASNRDAIMEGLIHALLGSEKNSGGLLFHPDKKVLIEKCLTILSLISNYCYDTEVSEVSHRMLICGIRIMQLLKDKKITTIDDSLEYKTKANDFVFTAKKYVYSPLAKTDIKGAMHYIYKNTSLQDKFLNECASFMEMYCSLT